MRWSGLCLVAGLGLVGCESPTQIEVTVDTNVSCGQVTGTSITSGTLGEIERIPPTATTTNCAGDHIGSIVLVPSGSNDALVGFKVVTATLGATIDTCVPDDAGAYGPNCIVARRALRFLPHSPLVVDVRMSSACEGVPCDSTTTCVEGQCVAATIGNSSQCEGTGCGEGALVDGGITPDAAPPGDAASDAPVDATLPPNEAGADGSVDAPSDAVVDGPIDATPAPVDSGYAGPVPGCDLSAAQPMAAWPMEDYCPTHRNRGAYVGPVDKPAPLWTLPLSGAYLDSPAIGADGTIYVGGSGVVEAVNPDGGVIWSYAADDAGLFQSTPIVAADGTLRAVDLASGTLVLLSLDGGAFVSSAPLTYEGNSGYGVRGGPTLAPDGTMYASDVDSDVLGFDTSGMVSFYVHGVSQDYVIPSIGAGGTIYAAEESVFALSPAGTVSWTAPTKATQQMASVSIAVDGTLRAVSPMEGFVFSFDADGGALWSVTTPAQQMTQPAIAVGDDGTTYMGHINGISAISSAGGDAGTFVGGPCTQPVIDGAGFVYAYCDQSLLRFSASLAQTWSLYAPLGTHQLPNDSPIIGPRGTVYLAVSNDSTPEGQPNAVYAFGPAH
jgi:hypothetical protein